MRVRPVKDALAIGLRDFVMMESRLGRLPLLAASAAEFSTFEDRA